MAARLDRADRTFPSCRNLSGLGCRWPRGRLADICVEKGLFFACFFMGTPRRFGRFPRRLPRPGTPPPWCIAAVRPGDSEPRASRSRSPHTFRAPPQVQIRQGGPARILQHLHAGPLTALNLVLPSPLWGGMWRNRLVARRQCRCSPSRCTCLSLFGGHLGAPGLRLGFSRVACLSLSFSGCSRAITGCVSFFAPAAGKLRAPFPAPPERS